jgi:hypothetical protein
MDKENSANIVMSKDSFGAVKAKSPQKCCGRKEMLAAIIGINIFFTVLFGSMAGFLASNYVIKNNREL